MWKSWKRRALAENKTDYSKYRFSWQEYLLCFFKAFFATGAFTGMFYRSWLGMLAFPAVWKVLYGRDKKNRIQKRKERLSLQFKDTILMVTAGIQAGSSIENAFLDVEREIGVLYGQNSEMGQELALIRKGLTNRVALEQMLLDFGRRSGIEEIRDFTEVFTTAPAWCGSCTIEPAHPLRWNDCAKLAANSSTAVASRANPVTTTHAGPRSTSCTSRRWS